MFPISSPTEQDAGVNMCLVNHYRTGRHWIMQHSDDSIMMKYVRVCMCMCACVRVCVCACVRVEFQSLFPCAVSCYSVSYGLLCGLCDAHLTTDVV